ncbi:MAG: hypothetical protein NT154_37030, partial [Verrucomicrobia bacterium]|nr:hypothetical protein [Verrucomicrobiota bacterium]
MKPEHLLVAFALLCTLGPGFASPENQKQPFKLTDKTLVAWVVPLSADPGFMGAFCIMENSTFDGITLTGGTNKQWITWSDFLRRTAKGETNWPVETVSNLASGTPICLVSVYKDNTVSVYRNGKAYLSYQIEPQPFFQFSKVVAGFDHQFPCEIDELRLYDVALTPEQVSSLRLNTYSGPVPLAQWTF